jgi:hypothetical protein
LPSTGADAVAVAVEGDAEVASLLLHLGLQLLEVLSAQSGRDGGTGSAVDLLVENQVLPLELVDSVADRLAGGAVAGVPGDLAVSCRASRRARRAA